jgi:hypothetical protein
MITNPSSVGPGTVPGGLGEIVGLGEWPGRAIRVQTNPVLSKDEMVTWAARQGLGKPRQLKLRFEKYQKLGLLGRMEGKESRQGGGGLWPPVQGALWSFYLKNPGEARLSTLANLPVFLWLIGIEGIDSEQAHRAFCFWTAGFGSERPSGPRSLRRRVIEARIASISSPTTSTSAKRKLRVLYEQLNDSIPNVYVDRDVFAKAFADVLGPEIEQGEAQQRARTEYGRILSANEAVKVRETLCRPQPATYRLWNWARDWLRGDLADELGSNRPLVPLDNLTVETLKAVEPFIGPTCWLLLATLGGAVAAPDRFPKRFRPPPLPLV